MTVGTTFKKKAYATKTSKCIKMKMNFLKIVQPLLFFRKLLPYVAQVS